MNGVSRFLSRRDKHHEKRGSKHLRNKVRPHFLSSPAPSPPKASSIDGSETHDSFNRLCRRTDSLHSLYHKLPSILQPYGGEAFPFLRKRPPCADLTPFHVQVSTTDSDHVTLQSQPVPTNLYTIFSNEELKPERDDAQKVCAPPSKHYLQNIPWRKSLAA